MQLVKGSENSIKIIDLDNYCKVKFQNNRCTVQSVPPKKDMMLTV